MLVDEVRILVSSGKGGDGSVSFHREKYRPKGGPDGGDGGRGGNICFVADRGFDSLVHLKDHPHQTAKGGGNGAKNNRTGADAGDLVIPVPPGTSIKDEAQTLLADLAKPGDRFLVAKGGRGGRGNAAFKTDSRRVPGFGELGEPGIQMWIRLEMRLIADVAVIGLPNAGKSTLVSALSAARPKVADYPFTTLEPSLGVVEIDEDRFTITDIPGLVEGAHKGKGLGLRFLKHAERAPVFVQVIDLSAGRDPLEDFEIVNVELARFRAELAGRPQIAALNKADLVGEEEAAAVLGRFKKRGLSALIISAAAGRGLDELTKLLWQTVKTARIDEPPAPGFQLFRTASDPITVVREGSGWRVDNSVVRRWVAMTDMSNPEAVAYLQNRLERAGAEDALLKAGAHHGDEVRIGSAVFEWWPAGSDPDPSGSQDFQNSGGRR